MRRRRRQICAFPVQVRCRTRVTLCAAANYRNCLQKRRNEKLGVTDDCALLQALGFNILQFSCEPPPSSSFTSDAADNADMGPLTYCMPAVHCHPQPICPLPTMAVPRDPRQTLCRRWD